MNDTKEKAEFEIYDLILNKDDQLSEHHIGIVAKVLADNLDKLREVIAKVDGGEG
tara:strand:+ start:251 stop:415 length:165 start_codon:yes stop_codon:yes gene_type:complete